MTACRSRFSQAAKHCGGSRRAVISQARIIQGEERTDRAVPSQGHSKRRLSRQCRRQLPCTQPSELRASASAAYEHRGNGKRGTGKELLPMQRSHAHPSCGSRSARWASSSQYLSHVERIHPRTQRSWRVALPWRSLSRRPDRQLAAGCQVSNAPTRRSGFLVPFLFFSFAVPARARRV